MSRSNRDAVGVPVSMECLEPRTLLDSSPLPLLSDLENAQDPVVRIETPYGDIDIELFPGEAPLSVAAVLDAVRRGQFAERFFHHGPANFVLQGGSLAYDTGVAADRFTLGPVTETSGRLADPRTVGIAPTLTNPSDPTTTSLTFAISNIPGGFNLIPIVVGRLVNDASWNVVMTIAALPKANLTSNPLFTTTPGPILSSVPTRSTIDPASVRYEDLVQMTDARVIKTQGSTEFFQSRLFFPEGFAGSTITEFVPVANPNDVPVTYQVIVHKELDPAGDRWRRDAVVFTGTIPANSRGGHTAWKADGTETAFRDAGMPFGHSFAYEIYSTRPLVATLSHYDFGKATGGSFTAEPGQSWWVTDVGKGIINRTAFLVWEVASGGDATVNLTFYFGSQEPITLSQFTRAHRRGGLDMNLMSQLPDGPVAVRITSTQPIVAGATIYDNNTGAGAFTTLGQPGEASSHLVVPLSDSSGNADQILFLLNPGATPAAVTITLRFNQNAADDQITSASVPAGRLGSLRLPHTGPYTVIMSSDAPIVANNTRFEFTRSTGATASSVAGMHWHFGEGFMDPGRAGTDVFEVLGVFNPNSTLLGATERDASVTIRFRYTDGFVLTLTRTVPAGERLQLNLHELPEILDQGRNNNRFFYATEVASDVNVVAEMWHFDLSLGGSTPAGGFSALGTAIGPTVRLDLLG
jgi:hypothetical protein